MEIATHQASDFLPIASGVQPSPVDFAGGADIQTETLPAGNVDGETTCDESSEACAHQVLKTANKTRKKGGAPPKNRNRTTTGIRGFMVTGSLPKGASYVRRVLSEFRQQLLADVTEATGSVSTYGVALIQSATRLECKSLLAGRWLKLEGEKLSVAERMNLVNQIADATLARDRILEKLGLAGKFAANADSSDPLEGLRAAVEAADAEGQ
jgi:hypothetical protein